MGALGNALGNHKLNIALARFKRACDRRSMVEVPDTLTSCEESLAFFDPGFRRLGWSPQHGWRLLPQEKSSEFSETFLDPMALFERTQNPWAEENWGSSPADRTSRRTGSEGGWSPLRGSI